MSVKENIITLGIESSCDETSVAVVKNGREVLSNVINSQIKIHEKYGGVVPEIASRNHIEAISRVTKLALKEANVEFKDIDAIILGCTHYPLFTNIFKMNLKTSAEIINTGTIIANSLISTLGKNLLNSKNNTGITQIYLTDTECNFISVAKNLLNVPSLVVNKADMTDIKIDISESSSINA